MRIGILSRNRNLYSTRRLVQAGRLRNHEIAVVDTLSIAVEVGPGEMKGTGIKVVKLKSRAGVDRSDLAANAVSHLAPFDAIIPRIGASVTSYGLAVVRQFEARGVLTTATATAIAQSRDKLQSLQIMSRAGLPTPRSAVISRPEALYSAIHAVGGVPVIIKLIQGTQGRGVLLVPNLATAAAVLEKLRGAKRQALVQEYVAEAESTDLRIIVVGNRCVAAMMRRAASGEFRANLHLGGTAEAITPDKHTKDLAVAAVEAHGLGVAGVDIIRSKRGPLLLEVNSSPGLQGIERVTQTDVAAEIIRFLERGRSNQRRRTTRRTRRHR